MSSFQTALAIVGAVVLIVVVAYNAWNTHRNAPRRARQVAQAAPPGEGEEPVRRDPLLDSAIADLGGQEGTSPAPAWQDLQIDPVAGAFAALGMGLNGVVTAVVLPWLG